MSIRRTPLLVVVVLLALTGYAGAANAERIGFEPAGEITSSGILMFRAGELSGECNVTLTGTVTRALVSTVSGTAIGELTGGTARCETGTTVQILIPRVMVIREILRPGGEVTGILVSVRNFGFLIEAGGLLGCLYGGELGVLIGVGREAAAVRVLNVPPLRLIRSLNIFTCPIEVTLGGTLSIRPAQRAIYLP
jgi:hypothetical protein